MRLHNIVVQGDFDNLYRLHLSHEVSIHPFVEPKDLRDEVSAQTFVWRCLQVDDETWLHILHSTDYPPDRHLDRIELRNVAIKLLVRGIITIYPLHLKSLDQRDSYLLIDTPDGLQYHFIPSQLLAAQALHNVKFFKSELESATQFVEQLALTDEQLIDVVRDPPLFFGRHPDAERTARIAGLLDAMSDGTTSGSGGTPERDSIEKKWLGRPAC